MTTVPKHNRSNVTHQSSLSVQVNLMTSFNSASFPDSLAIAKESGLIIGSIDEIQKLHIRAVPLGEQARRLAHQESTHTLLVTTSSNPSGTLFAPCCRFFQTMLVIWILQRFIVNHISDNCLCSVGTKELCPGVSLTLTLSLSLYHSNPQVR